MKRFAGVCVLLSAALLTLNLIASEETKVVKAQVCNSGKAGNYPCRKVDLQSALDLANSGIESDSGNDIWGWTDPLNGREYAIMGLSHKTSFVDITDPRAPVHIGDLPTQTARSDWRDIKVYKNHVFIVSEASGHGLQIFDLEKLRAFDRPSKPVVFDQWVHYDLFGNAHNVVINEESGYAYVVGSNTCDQGMHIIDIRVPKEPKFVSCIDREIFEPPVGLKFHGDTYTHDAQCVVYRGPDLRYHGKEICVASNDDSLNIVDVEDKAKLRQLSAVKYPNYGYVHQGWLTEDHKYFLLGDELDEMNNDTPTSTLIFNVSDLENPILIGRHIHGTKSIDHNLYVKGNYVYEANYTTGLRILELANIAQGKLSEVAYFDNYLPHDMPQFNGAWSIFPFFKSGTVILSDIGGKLFILKPNL